MTARRRWGITTSALIVSLAAASCGSDSSSTEATTAPATEATTAAATEATTAAATEATTAEATGSGQVVTIFSSIRDAEADRLEQAWKPFEDATGIDIQHEGSGTFEDDLKLRVAGGNAPDLAFVPQPGLFANLARDGKLVALSSLEADVKANDIAGWLELGTVDGKFYGPPFGANIKSLVWYSPEQFTTKGYEIPATWQEMLDLSQKIVDDGGTPWCVGAESGGATGWVLTDWVEDVVLRVSGAEVYDKWVTHEIPFDDPSIVAAVDAVGDIVKNDDFVLNGAASIPSTSFQEAGLPLLTGECFMHRQASFYGNQFPEETTKGPDGQVNAFYLPTVNADDPKVMLGGGELIGAFRDAPEVLEVAQYLTSAEFANSRFALGNWLSPNKSADISLITDPLEKSFAELLVGSDIFRFDASDLMPGAVGAGTFWTEMVEWVTGKSTADALKAIDGSWPAS